jgi:hypothetical protein
VKGISGFGMKLIALDNEDCDDYFMPQLIWKFKKSDKNSFRILRTKYWGQNVGIPTTGLR